MLEAGTSGKTESAMPWKMGYAGLTTLILMLWVILNSLSQDQTGVKFQKGLENWRSNQGRMGLPSEYWAQQEPKPEPESPSEVAEEGDPKDIAAKNRAKLAGFVADIGLRFKSAKKPRALGQFVIDVFDPPADKKPFLLTAHHEALAPALPFFKQRDYRISIIMWANSPGTSAWLRAQQQAQRVSAELLEKAGSSTRADIHVFAQPWAHVDQPRPAFSLILAKVASTPPTTTASRRTE